MVALSTWESAVALYIQPEGRPFGFNFVFPHDVVNHNALCDRELGIDVELQVFYRSLFHFFDEVGLVVGAGEKLALGNGVFDPGCGVDVALKVVGIAHFRLIGRKYLVCEALVELVHDSTVTLDQQLHFFVFGTRRHVEHHWTVADEAEVLNKNKSRLS